MSAKLLDERAENASAPIKLCECGCGQPVKQWKHNDRHQGRVKGEYARFIYGHNTRSKEYQGPVFLDKLDGYLKFVGRDGHKYFFHRIVMENEIGRELKPEEVVHHINKIRSDDRPENLMLFENDAKHRNYHYLLERSKYPNGMKPCSKCGQLKDFSEFSKSKCNPDGLEYQCKACKNAYYRDVIKKKNEGARNAKSA